MQAATIAALNKLAPLDASVADCARLLRSAGLAARAAQSLHAADEAVLGGARGHRCEQILSKARGSLSDLRAQLAVAAQAWRLAAAAARETGTPTRRGRAGSRGTDAAPAWTLPDAWWRSRAEAVFAGVRRVRAALRRARRALTFDAGGAACTDGVDGVSAYVAAITAAAAEGARMAACWASVRDGVDEWEEIARIVASGELGESGSMLPG